VKIICYYNASLIESAAWIVMGVVLDAPHVALEVEFSIKKQKRVKKSPKNFSRTVDVENTSVTMFNSRVKSAQVNMT